MWKSLNWVAISSEKGLEVTTWRFDQYALIVMFCKSDVSLEHTNLPVPDACHFRMRDYFTSAVEIMEDEK